MPFADAIPDQMTDEMMLKHQAYLDAMSAHNAACADPSMTTTQRCELALASVRRWREFAEACGVPMPSVSLDQKARRSDEQVATYATAIGTAITLLQAIEMGGLLNALPADDDQARHNVGSELMFQALDGLRAAVAS